MCYRLCAAWAARVSRLRTPAPAAALAWRRRLSRVGAGPMACRWRVIAVLIAAVRASSRAGGRVRIRVSAWLREVDPLIAASTSSATPPGRSWRRVVGYSVARAMAVRTSWSSVASKASSVARSMVGMASSRVGRSSGLVSSPRVLQMFVAVACAVLVSVARAVRRSVGVVGASSGRLKRTMSQVRPAVKRMAVLRVCSWSRVLVVDMIGFLPVVVVMELRRGGSRRSPSV
ncbi:Hypothetical protein PFR_JS25-2_38 [Propionibacterium freudenreichii]|nr:Hypothetical protein PFR_JS25-2_38 [Propionibacterium freudenreichii]